MDTSKYKTLEEIDKRIQELDAIIATPGIVHHNIILARMEREQLLWDYYNKSPKHN